MCILKINFFLITLLFFGIIANGQEKKAFEVKRPLGYFIRTLKFPTNKFIMNGDQLIDASIQLSELDSLSKNDKTHSCYLLVLREYIGENEKNEDSLLSYKRAQFIQRTFINKYKDKLKFVFKFNKHNDDFSDQKGVSGFSITIYPEK